MGGKSAAGSGKKRNKSAGKMRQAAPVTQHGKNFAAGKPVPLPSPRRYKGHTILCVWRN
jgi:hypothetical protein